MARILIVEDEDIQRKALEAMLRADNHQVLLAANGATALMVAEDKKPDLVVTDLQMPKMDGKELIGRLRASPGLGGLYIVACTSLEGEVPRLEVLLAGADDFVRKPVQKEDLLHRVDQGVKIRMLRREADILKGKVAAGERMQDALAVCVDGALRALEEAGAHLGGGNPAGAREVLGRAREKLAADLAAVPMPEA
jgi:CheY-like chemotaxis protein